MRNKWQVVIGAFIILVGLMILIGNLTGFNFWKIFWPLLLIGLGIVLLLRPQMISSDATVRQKLLGDIRLDGEWQVTDEEIWLLVGDVRIDLTEAQIPAGETKFRIFGFVGDVRMIVPAGVGISVQSNAFVTDSRVLGEKRESFLAPMHFATDDYETAERKIRLETGYFVADIKVKQV